MAYNLSTGLRRLLRVGDDVQGRLDGLADPSKREEMEQSLSMALDICRTGETKGFLALNEGLKGDDKAFNDALLKDRNLRWLPKLEQLFQQGSVFVAAGAAHMIGPWGVTDLLRQRGWTVERQRGVTARRPKTP